MVFEIVSIGDGLRYRNFTPAMGGYRPVILTLGSSTDGDCFMKRPSFQFYPSDWLRDTALRTCSVSARGLWIDMICYMHEGTPYGYLKVNDKVILPSNLAAMCGATLENVEGWLKELETAGVFKRDENGVIHSKRMIRDEEIRNSRASGGKLGGNPALLKVGKVNHKVQNKDKPNPTPSSSSSSSSSSSLETIKPLSNKFDEFWSTWPSSTRKVGKMACFKKWEARKLDSIGDRIIAHVKSDRKSTRLNSSHVSESRMPSSA